MKQEKKPKTRWLLDVVIPIFILLIMSYACLLVILKLLLVLSVIELPPSSPSASKQMSTEWFRAPRQGGITQRHVEPQGGFSFVPPEGWEIRSFPGAKYKMAFGPQLGGKTPNIVVADEFFPGSLDDFVKASIESTVQVKPNIKVVKREDFTTAEGLEGRRVFFEDRGIGPAPYRYIVYLFGRGQTKFAICCTSVGESADQLDAVFEGCVKTFRFEGQENVSPPSTAPEAAKAK
jgi:hypothetical protein